MGALESKEMLMSFDANARENACKTTLWTSSIRRPMLLRSILYATIRYDTVYLTCSKKLTDSQLSLPHGMNKKCKRRN